MKRIFVPLTKVDAVQRLVYGVAAVEQVDKSGEIFDYETSKPLFQSWSGEIEKLSIPAVQAFGENAKSYGNVREMHGKNAAGKLAAPIGFNDATKVIEVCSKVTDDAAWQKVQDGVYTGFSIGGKYVKSWADSILKNVTRYTAQPSEISLVDNPCMPGATFEFIKGADSQELRKFSTVTLTPEDFPLAVTNVCKALGDGPELAAAHESAARVIAQAEELKVDISGFAEAYVKVHGGALSTLAIRKGMYDISDIASVISSLNYCRLCLQSEAEWEGDGSEIPGRLKSVVQTLSAILVDLVAEETSELTAEKMAADLLGEDNTMKKFFATHKDAIAKMAASSDPEVVKVATELIAVEKALPAEVPAVEKAAEAGSLEKAMTAVKALGERLTKSEEAQNETTAQIKNLVAVFETFVKSAPAAPRVAINPQTVDKAADSGGAPVEKIDPKDPEAAMKLIKAAHAGGAVLIK